jgi:hypothetical protein
LPVANFRITNDVAAHHFLSHDAAIITPPSRHRSTQGLPCDANRPLTTDYEP